MPPARVAMDNGTLRLRTPSEKTGTSMTSFKIVLPEIKISGSSCRYGSSLSFHMFVSHAHFVHGLPAARDAKLTHAHRHSRLRTDGKQAGHPLCPGRS